MTTPHRPLPVASHHTGWASVPLAARGPVSAALGRDLAGYHVLGLRATNRAQHLRVAFSRRGVAVASGVALLRMSLAGLGYASAIRPVAPVTPVAAGNGVSYRHRNLSEWYANGPLGLEQGFEIGVRPRAGTGPLTVAVALSGGDVSPRLEHGGVLLAGRGASLRYDDLIVSDARGRILRSWFALAPGRLEIRVDDHGAQYPLRIDPLVQQAELTASDAGPGDNLGYSVAVSGDGSTVVAGAPKHPTSSDGTHTGPGAVYVFSEPAGGWQDTRSPMTQAAELTASNGASGSGTAGGDYLGASVAVSGDGSTVVAGAPNATTGGNQYGGAVYVFTKPTNGWGSTAQPQNQTAELTAPDGASRDQLGYSVAVSADGSTVVAGSPFYSSSHGMAYVFTEPTDGWESPVQAPAELTAPDCTYFAWSVAVSGDGATVAVGSWGAFVGQDSQPGAVYVFTRSSDAWASTSQPDAELTASDGANSDELGWSVAISADASTIVAGAPIASVGGNAKQGAAYVFTKPPDGWGSTAQPQSQAAKLTASDGASGDQLGYSVGLSSDGSTVFAGAPDATIGGNTWQGAIYQFTQPPTGWGSTAQPQNQAAKLTRTYGSTDDSLGTSAGVSSDGSTVVGGIDNSAGAAFVFGPSSAMVNPSLSVSAPSSATTASPIAGSSVVGKLAQGAAPTGNVTFFVFGPQASAPGSCLSGGTVVGTAVVSGNGAYHPSGAFTPSAPGTYWWFAVYGGDANNYSAASACGSSMPKTTVATPTTTSAPPTTTSTPPITTSTGTPPSTRPAFPKVPAGQLSGVGGKHLALDMVISGDGAKVISLTIHLPGGLSLARPRSTRHGTDQRMSVRRKTLRSPVSVTGAKVKRVRFTAHVVTITLKRGVASLKVKLSDLKLSSALRAKIRAKKIKKLTGKITAKATNGRTGTVTYSIALKRTGR